MTVTIHGKEYKTVAERVDEFRKNEGFQGYGILTEIISAADLVQIKASIVDGNDRVVATGFAEEVRGSTNINKTSALENCETSAIGRALACIGLGGTQYATANEVADAMIQQAQQEVVEFYDKHNKAVYANWNTLTVMRESMANNDLSTASEAWYELDEDLQRTLFRAPSKGGFFTTAEIATIKSREFRVSHFGETENNGE